MMERFCNILLIQLGDIGDVVLTTPAIRAVKETYPDARVSIMVRKPFGSLLAEDPNLYEVVESIKPCGSLLLKLKEYIGFVVGLRRARYDLVIDLRTGDRGAFLSFITGAEERVGYRGNRPGFLHKVFFSKIISDIPVGLPSVHPGADQSLRIMRKVGIDTDNSHPQLFIACNNRERVTEILAEYGLGNGTAFLTINPCSRWEYKEWDYERWGDVAEVFWQKYKLFTLLVGAPEDRAKLDLIAINRASHVYNLAGKTTLAELAALLSMSVLHLGVDSAAPHIAAAVGVPTVTIFGPGNWKGWTKVDDLHRVVTSEMPCAPCNRKGCDDSGISLCLDKLDSEPIIRAADEILQIKELNELRPITQC